MNYLDRDSAGSESTRSINYGASMSNQTTKATVSIVATMLLLFLSYPAILSGNFVMIALILTILASIAFWQAPVRL